MPPSDHTTDLVILGGGIAGLWLLARLTRLGYSVLLLERHALGQGQTRHAQGIIHGGTKYALTGEVSAASQAIATMPGRWRACLDGHGELDLSAVQLLAEHQFLWSTRSLTSRLAGFFASKLMRSRMVALEPGDYPEALRHPDFKGQVYQLDEPVLDTASLVRALADPLADRIARLDDNAIVWNDNRLEANIGGQRRTIAAKRLILTAGQGNAELLATLGQHEPAMQLRPLNMVMARGGLPGGLYAHCLGASANPRLTISSHTAADGEPVWYLGGQIAEQGVGRPDAEQVAAARAELAELLPWVDLSQTRFAPLPIDRAEVKRPDGSRPETPSLHESVDGVMTAWPTKLAFAPLLADQVEAALMAAEIPPTTAQPGPTWPHPGYALLPWQEARTWS